MAGFAPLLHWPPYTIIAWMKYIGKCQLAARRPRPARLSHCLPITAARVRLRRCSAMVITSTRALPLTLMLLGGGATTLQFRAPVLVLHVNGSANTGGDPGLQPDSFVALDAAGKHLFGSSQSAHHPWHSSDSGATWRLGGEVSVGPVLSSRGGAFYGLTRTSPMGSAHALGIGPPPWFAEKGVNVGCDATSTRHCPGLACDLTHSPIALEISINASNGALLMIDTCRQVSHTLPPHLLNRSIGLYNHRGAQPTDAVRLQDGTFVQIIPIQLAGETPSVPFPGSPASTTTYPTSLVAFTSQDGYAWEFASIVASKQTNLPWSFYGPTEFDLTLLADNKTLLAVFRPDSDSSCPGEPKYRWYHQACESSATTYQYKVRSGVFSPFHSSTNYARSTAPVDMVADSTDGGKQWSSPRPIPGAGCVRPKLLLLPGGGPLLLLGGRLCKHLNLDAQQCMPSSGGAGSRDVGAESILLWVNE